MSASRGTARIVCPAQEQRCSVAPVAQGFPLEHAERDRRCAVLPGRAECAELASVERELEVVAVGARMREPALEVQPALCLECAAQCDRDVTLARIERVQIEMQIQIRRACGSDDRIVLLDSH